MTTVVCFLGSARGLVRTVDLSGSGRAVVLSLSLCRKRCRCVSIDQARRATTMQVRTVGLSGSRSAVLLREMQCCWSVR